MDSLTRAQLQESVQSLCDAFATHKSIDEILFHFSNNPNVRPTAMEHGHRHLAPFLGRRFVGLQKIREYFELLSELLIYRDMRFSNFIVDVEMKKVSVTGNALFEWKDTGDTWDEVFVWALDVGGDGKVVHYQVWADSGAAYLARLGKLKDIEH
jgi:hypothetical protein